MTRIEVTGTWRFYRTGAMIVSRPRRVHEVGTLERPPPFSPLGMTGAPPFQRSVAFAPGTASSAPAPPGAAALAVATRCRRRRAAPCRCELAVARKTCAFRFFLPCVWFYLNLLGRYGKWELRVRGK